MTAPNVIIDVTFAKNKNITAAKDWLHRPWKKSVKSDTKCGALRLKIFKFSIKQFEVPVISEIWGKLRKSVLTFY